MEFDFDKTAFDRAPIWFVIGGLPVLLVGILLYRARVINGRILVYVFGTLSLTVGNLVAIWQAVPALHLGLKLLFAVGATLLILPFMILGDVLSRKRKMH